MRRNRMLEFSRRLVSENNLSVDDLIYPIFITYGSKKKEKIDSMPGIYRFSLDLLAKEIEYISNLMKDNGSTEIKIKVKDDNNHLTFKLKNRRLVDRKSIIIIKNHDFLVHYIF